MAKYYLEMHAYCHFCSIDFDSIELDQEFPRVKTAAKLVSNLIYQNQGLISSLIMGGYDDTDGYQVYVIPLGGACFRKDIATAGSGSTFMQGFVDKNYRKGMSFQECREFMLQCKAS